ncbi:hypothetical protein C3F09_02705 [candidate division GN15 bacterium]|uniref:D-glucuronyl C5-epimerase C-terminal domain-containing protein n=1 Tax=candidate division GN15 bacterium TaxID=2072418 RepID=A0A855X413_9BACT|nr:MAG: hypothetical protein C3F09_02705 [candidate division GN15 bacterium]
MINLSEQIANLSEYFGVRSTHYYHASTPSTYDPADPLVYYVDESARAAYTRRFDAQGIPLYVEGRSAVHLPVFLCFYALGHLEIYRKQKNDESLARFLKIADWLAANQNGDGVWLNPLPNRKFGLHQPSPSAMIQGLAISCLHRAAMVADNRRFHEAAAAALMAYGKDVRHGGVATVTDGHVFYEEYPSNACPHVLNGFLYAMWGLWDLARTGNGMAADLYNQGFRTFIEWLPRYDMGFWSRYNLSNGPDNPATLHYHRLHIDQLTVMHQISAHDLIREYRDKWQGYLDNRWNPLRTLPKKLRWRFFYSGSASD